MEGYSARVLRVGEAARMTGEDALSVGEAAETPGEAAETPGEAAPKPTLRRRTVIDSVPRSTEPVPAFSGKETRPWESALLVKEVVPR